VCVYSCVSVCVLVSHPLAGGRSTVDAWLALYCTLPCVQHSVAGFAWYEGGVTTIYLPAHHECLAAARLLRCKRRRRRVRC